MSMDIVQQIFELCVVPLLAILTTYIVKLVQKKINEIESGIDNKTAKKYVEMLNDTIAECVVATNQTYVWALKQQGTFDKEAQKEALKITQEKVMEILTDEAKEYLNEFYGDLETYVIAKIESTVNTEAEIMGVLKK